MVVTAFVVPLALLVRNQAEDRGLNRAQREAQAVASGLAVAVSLAPESGASPELVDLVVDATGDPARTTVFLPDGSAIGAAGAAGANVERAAQGSAFTVRVPAGAEVFVPVLAGDGTLVVRTAVPNDELRSGVRAAWALLGALGLAMIGVAVLAADRLGRSLVRPVADLAEAAHRLGEGDLEARVEPTGTEEVAELGAVFNRLASRLDGLLAAERESVADLSHRLRTPLTALRLQVETLDDSAARESLLADIGRLERDVDRLIADARRSARDREDGVADLCAVVRHRAEFWSVLAEEQERPVAVRLPPNAQLVAMAEAELGAMIDALLENVFSHTPPGTGYEMSVHGGLAAASLIVADDGPGMPESGVVSRGRSGSGSTGLGLDIVRRAAERSGGRLVVGSGRAGGAHIEVVLGRAPRG